jgi:tRNA A-37 threonylcarbamoyl transferase component Bud32/CheY-like chemotaxis protein
MGKKQAQAFQNIIPKILVVAPKADDRRFFQSILAFQYKIEAVSHGYLAKSILSADSEFNIAIIANDLPDMVPLELFNSIFADSPWIKTIIFKSYAGEQTEEIFPNQTPFLSKPIQVDILLETIKNLLEEQKNKYEAKPSKNKKIGKRTVSGYTILDTIGVGNIGKIELVEKNGKRYALKTLQGQRHLSQFRAYKERFHREAEVLLKIHHPCLIKVFEYSPTDPSFIVMEYIEGKSLFEHIVDNSLNFKQKISIIKELASVLETVHHSGVLHRDIKPGNVLITKDFHVKLTDFGIARTLESDLTLTGEVIGSPSYMAPETFASMKNIDKRADIFSLGALSYELLTGEQPFKGNSVIETMHEIQTTKPVSPSKLHPNFPKPLEKILNKMLKKAPEDRYQDAGNILKDLEKIK